MNEDAIDRKLVCAFIDGLISDDGEREKGLEYIRSMPPVNPQEPKTGHWILSDDGLYRPICDKCGAHPWKGYIPTVEEATEVFKYCPNCGCRMVFEPQERSNKE